MPRGAPLPQWEQAPLGRLRLGVLQREQRWGAGPIQSQSDRIQEMFPIYEVRLAGFNRIRREFPCQRRLHKRGLSPCSRRTIRSTSFPCEDRLQLNVHRQLPALRYPRAIACCSGGVSGADEADGQKQHCCNQSQPVRFFEQNISSHCLLPISMCVF